MSRYILDARIPFEIADTQPLYHQWISAQIKEREKRAVDPDTVWYSHEDFWQKVKELTLGGC